MVENDKIYFIGSEDLKKLRRSKLTSLKAIIRDEEIDVIQNSVTILTKEMFNIFASCE